MYTDYSNTTFLEYQKKKKEMLNDLGRISGACHGVNCIECPLLRPLENHPDCDVCEELEILYPQEALNIVMSYEPKVDWTKVPVDTKILVKCSKNENWRKRYFSKYSNGIVYAYHSGSTSFSSEGNDNPWTYAKLYKGNEE